MQAQHVLVTGGAGFIGSHLVERLLADGHRVTVLDDLSTGSRANLSDAFAAANGHLSLVEGDVRVPLAGQLSAACASGGPVTRVVHLAAQVSVPASIRDPMADRATNLDGAHHVLSYAHHADVGKVVLASSAAVYGDAPLPAQEDARCEPQSPYGTHKLAAEHYARQHASLHGVPTTNLRFFNVYGPRQSPQSGYAGVISIFIGRAVEGRPLVIFGDGAQTRDFVWVGDVVRAIRGALFGGPADGAPVNVGTGTAISLNALAHAVLEATGSESLVHHAEARPGDILHSRADTTRLAETLGLSLGSPLVTGLAATARWLQGGPSSILALTGP
jgi:UDP-glucose 4-epimerase